MKKIGTLYSKDNKENTCLGMEMPTRRKQSIDSKSNYTRTSQKDSEQLFIKSTYLESHSASHYDPEEHSSETLREYHTFKDSSVKEESFFDSLDIYSQKQEKGQ